MFPVTIAQQLRRRGHDSVSIHDIDYRWLEGLPDEEVFRIAAAEGRAISPRMCRIFGGWKPTPWREAKSVPPSSLRAIASFPAGSLPRSANLSSR